MALPANKMQDANGVAVFHKDGKPIIGFLGSLGSPRKMLDPWIGRDEPLPKGIPPYDINDIALFVEQVRNHAWTV